MDIVADSRWKAFDRQKTIRLEAALKLMRDKGRRGPRDDLFLCRLNTATSNKAHAAQDFKPGAYRNGSRRLDVTKLLHKSWPSNAMVRELKKSGFVCHCRPDACEWKQARDCENDFNGNLNNGEPKRAKNGFVTCRLGSVLYCVFRFAY